MILNRSFATTPWDFTNLFDDFLARTPRARSWEPRPRYNYPPINVHYNNDHVVVTSEMPGMEADDIDISIKGNVLTLSGERKTPQHDEEDNLLRNERRFGQFSRSLQMPFEIDPDSVKAQYKNGVLEIKLDRSEADKPKKIQVQSS
jgi:HSP20 family protein